MTYDPLPGTPLHEVLLHPAFGDHQVANVSADIEARTIGASVRWPALAPAATRREPVFGIPTWGRFPFGGYGTEVWDNGIAAPPTTNTPPREGQDPHSAPRKARSRAGRSPSSCAPAAPDRRLRRRPCVP